MIEEAALSNNKSDISEIAGNLIKRYIDRLKDISKLTCLIHGPGNSSDECEVLDEFGTKNSKGRPAKYLRQELATRKSLEDRNIKML